MTKQIAQSTFIVAGLDCPNEEKLIRQQFSSFKKIEKMDFNYLAEEVVIYHDQSCDLEFFKKQFKAIHMDVELKSQQTELKPLQEKKSAQWWPLAWAGFFALLSELLNFNFPIYASVIALLAIMIAGPGTFKKGWIAFKTKTININSLMLIAIFGAICIGQWPEAAMVTVLFAIAEQIEHYSLEKARHAIRSLMQVSPAQANLKIAEGQYKKVNIDSIQVGAHLLIKPGERIPLDGVVTHGKSRVDQAAITGESNSVTKRTGDEVFAGTLNQHGSIEIQATTSSRDTLLAKIAKTIEEAQSQRAPTQRFVDVFSKYYTPLMVICALLVAIVPPLVFGQDVYAWVYKALTLLIIACPCALVISTPVSIVSGLANAAQHGILIKGGHLLENGHLLQLIAFDKTGTLTKGQPAITDCIIHTEASETLDYLKIAVSLESHSEHPIAQAFINYWNQQNKDDNLLNILEFEAIPGLGIKGYIDNNLYYLGNHRLAEQLNICSPDIETQLNALEKQGKTTTILATESKLLAIFAVADKLREDSLECIQQLHQLGKKAAMLTGDNPLVAYQIAEKLQIDSVHASLIPIDKLNAISQFLKEYQYVGMVGDGINDAPALAKASISFAMGKGTETALETADISLMNEHLALIPYFIRLSKKTKQILQQNISLAIAVKIIFFILALSGLATLWMAIFADMGTSLIVVLNGLRLIYFNSEQKKIP